MHPKVREEIEDTIRSLRGQRVIDRSVYDRLFPTFGALLAQVRAAAKYAEEEIAAEQNTSTVSPIEAPASFDEIVNDLWVASRARQQFGASRAQIETIARLAVRDGLTLSQITCSTLTKGEASAIISSF